MLPHDHIIMLVGLIVVHEVHCFGFLTRQEVGRRATRCMTQATIVRSTIVT